MQPNNNYSILKPFPVGSKNHSENVKLKLIDKFSCPIFFICLKTRNAHKPVQIEKNTKQHATQHIPEPIPLRDLILNANFII